MRYSAFISYNFQDKAWATWLHRALENYRLPKHLQGHDGPFGPIGPRLPSVFRDRDELAVTTDLGRAVKDALEQAETLIVVCSPNAVRSHWVSEEIRYFISLGRQDRVFCLIVATAEGDLGIGTAMPAALSERGDSEPLAADARQGQDGRTAAKLKLIAGILKLNFDDLRRREAVRRQRQLAAVTAASLAGVAVTTALAISALLARNEAVRERDIARQQTLTAQRTVSFIQSMFQVADPSEAQGAKVTARQVVDQSARQLQSELNNEPAVKAQLTVTLAEVYGGLGLYKESADLVGRSLKIPHGQASISAHQYLVIGEDQFSMGDYANAVASFQHAQSLAQSAGAAADDLRSRILVGLGQAQTAIGQTQAASASIGQALILDQAASPAAPSDVARDLEASGDNENAMNQLAPARAAYQRALALRLKAEGPNSPSLANDDNNLGAIADEQYDFAGATAYFQRALKVYDRVLDPQDPSFGAPLNGLARTYIERRQFALAEPLLKRTVAINLKERGETFDDMAYVYANLAIVERGLGRTQQAEGLFEKALKVAKPTNNPDLAPIMTDMAEMDCQARRTAAGLELLKAARPIMSAAYSQAPWHTAWIDGVRGECLRTAGKAVEARPLLLSGARTVLASWTPDTLMGTEAEHWLQLAEGPPPTPKSSKSSSH